MKSSPLNIETMNVLVLAPQPFFQNRGTPIAVRELVNAVAARGSRIDLVTYHEGEDVFIPNCQIHRIPAPPGIHNIRPGFSWKKVVCDVVLCFTALRLARRRRYDLVHAVEEAAFIGLLLKMVHRVPYVYDMDSSLPRQLSEKYPLPRLVVKALESMERLVVRHSLGVVAVCESLEQTARQYAPEKIIARVEDKSLLEEASTGGEDLCEQHGLTGLVVMYVGNMEPYQGIDLLLEAHQLLLRDVPNAELILIGGIPEHIEAYRRRAGQLGVAERTHFLGPRPNSQLGHFLRQAHVLVSPRIQGDNTPMKIYSYLDSERPVLATRLPTHTQVLDDEIAYLVPPDAASMARGLATLLRDAELRELLAFRAKLKVEQFYGPEAFERKVNDFYGQLEQAIKP